MSSESGTSQHLSTQKGQKTTNLNSKSEQQHLNNQKYVSEDPEKMSFVDRTANGPKGSSSNNSQVQQNESGFMQQQQLRNNTEIKISKTDQVTQAMTQSNFADSKRQQSMLVAGKSGKQTEVIRRTDYSKREQNYD